MRIDWNAPSFCRGVASTQSMPPADGNAASSNSLSSEAPASSAAGVAPSAWPSRRTLTWFRSTSWIQTLLPSETINCSKGLV